MRQSSVIFAVLLFAFVVYITIRGQLPAYFELFSREKSQYSPAGNAGGHSVFDTNTNKLKQRIYDYLNGKGSNSPFSSESNLGQKIKDYLGK